MDLFNIDDEQSYTDYVEYLLDNKPEVKIDHKTGRIESDDCVVMAGEYFGQVLEVINSYSTILGKEEGVKYPGISELSTEKVVLSNEDFDFMMEKIVTESPSVTSYDPLIYGKDATENIVSIEIVGNEVWLFREVDGLVTVDKRPYRHWILSNKPARDGKTVRLEGGQFYKYLKEYDNREEWNEARKMARKFNLYCVTNPTEGAMIRHGYTFYKNTKISEVSVLSFDLETTGLKGDAPDAKILLISNTARKNGIVTRKLFSIDEHNDSEKDMLLAWVKYVQQEDPSILLGYNVCGFDGPYLLARAEANNITLDLGRDCSPMQKEKFERKFRKDGSQEYGYNRINIFGRQFLDMFFVSIRYDFSRKYSNYKLKTIIKEENLEKENRTFYDASKIRTNWYIPGEKEKIKEYCRDDADDSLALYDLMAAAQFYLCQYLPRPFQIVSESATGSQINAFLVRSYLQHNGAIPLASDTTYVQGGISFGVPGVYNQVVKADLKSAYPSQVLRFKLYDKVKDPHANFYNMVKFFTDQRFENKRKGNETGDRYYKDLDSTGKIFINSAYGLLTTSGLNYNNSELAAKITGETRKVIEMAVKWASGNTIDKYWTKNEKD